MDGLWAQLSSAALSLCTIFTMWILNSLQITVLAIERGGCPQAYAAQGQPAPLLGPLQAWRGSS